MMQSLKVLSFRQEKLVHTRFSDEVEESHQAFLVAFYGNSTFDTITRVNDILQDRPGTGFA